MRLPRSSRTSGGVFSKPLMGRDAKRPPPAPQAGPRHPPAGGAGQGAAKIGPRGRPRRGARQPPPHDPGGARARLPEFAPFLPAAPLPPLSPRPRAPPPQQDKRPEKKP